MLFILKCNINVMCSFKPIRRNVWSSYFNKLINQMHIGSLLLQQDSKKKVENINVKCIRIDRFHLDPTRLALWQWENIYLVKKKKKMHKRVYCLPFMFLCWRCEDLIDHLLNIIMNIWFEDNFLSPKYFLLFVLGVCLYVYYTL